MWTLTRFVVYLGLCLGMTLAELDPGCPDFDTFDCDDFNRVMVKHHGENIPGAGQVLSSNWLAKHG
jgi:hypothetical protein